MLRPVGRPLFRDEDLDRRLGPIREAVTAAVDRIPPDQLLATSLDTLAEYIVAQLSVKPLTVYQDQVSMEHHEARVNVGQDPDYPVKVPGVRVVVSLPYSGDASLWKLKPSSWWSTFPYGDVSPPDANGIGTLALVFEQPADRDFAEIRRALDKQLKEIGDYIDAQKQQLDRYNAALPSAAESAIKARRERLQKQAGLSEMLGIPLRPRPGEPDFVPITLEKRVARPLPQPPRGGYQAEPGIAEETFEQILRVIRHTGRTFEQTPATFAMHDEEGLRDILLAHLNVYFEGRATAETFRRLGKTDVRIEDNDRAAFVAECKVWRGAKEILAACDQLCGYLTWRDCKAALIVFNTNNARFSKILEDLPTTISNHPRFLREHKVAERGEWRFDLRSSHDEGREIRVQVMAFDLFVRSSGAS